MSPAVAFSIVTWAAIVLLFFGLAAVMREVRLLRAAVLRNPDGYTSTGPDIELGAELGGADGPHIVLAADSGCPLCLAVIERLRYRGVKATLLTHEQPAVWRGIADHLTVVSDQEVWRSVSHLAPPVLMMVDRAGSVRKLVLPAREDEVDTVLDDWAGTGGEETHRVANADGNS
jgi:hypothetical protein